MKEQKRFDELKACVLIPSYNNDKTLKTVIDGVLEYTNNVIIVNDGSTDNTSAILSNYPNLTIEQFEQNQGKGAALKKGFELAIAAGYHHAISIDSDAQHKPTDLPIFLTAIKNDPACLYVGARNMNSENVPGKSNFGYRVSNFWYRVASGVDLPDTQSGYRSYPVQLMKDIKLKTNRFEFEVEVLVKTAWEGIGVSHVPIDVYYPPSEERVSHFRTIRDFTRITMLNIVFVPLGLLIGRPKLFVKEMKKKSFKEAFKILIYDPKISNLDITKSVMLGVFIGITPFFGFQILLILLFAQMLNLNKAIAFIAGHISIPPAIPFWIYSSYKIGAILLQNENTFAFDNGITLEWVRDNYLQYALGAFVLAFAVALVLGLICALILLIFRRNKGKKIAI